MHYILERRHLGKGSSITLGREPSSILSIHDIRMKKYLRYPFLFTMCLPSHAPAPRSASPLLASPLMLARTVLLLPSPPFPFSTFVRIWGAIVCDLRSYRPLRRHPCCCLHPPPVGSHHCQLSPPLSTNHFQRASPPLTLTRHPAHRQSPPSVRRLTLGIHFRSQNVISAFNPKS